MKTSGQCNFSFILILVLLSSPVHPQVNHAKDGAHENLTLAAREIISSAGTCALITLDEEGRPRVRAMDPFPPEADFTIWFGTNLKSRKVSQIKYDPRVTLYYLDGDASGYVMVHGRAELVNDNTKKEKYWKQEWEAFYPNNRENFLLIKVSPLWMEVSSFSRGINGDTLTWQPPSVRFNTTKEKK